MGKHSSMYEWSIIRDEFSADWPSLHRRRLLSISFKGAALPVLRETKDLHIFSHNCHLPVPYLPPPPLDGASAAAATSRDFWRPSLLQNGLTGLLVAIIINGWRLRTDTIKSWLVPFYIPIGLSIVSQKHILDNLMGTVNSFNDTISKVQVLNNPKKMSLKNKDVYGGHDHICLTLQECKCTYSYK